MDANNLLKAALPGAIVGVMVYVFSTIAGPRIGPGWQDILQGGAFFVGLIWIAISVSRAARRAKTKRD
ncbi:MAG TPA: hypothetical protein VKQ32_02995 [Polyangia bacterium]|nr:hypothetical protein [Polyangia bacterium]